MTATARLSLLVGGLSLLGAALAAALWAAGPGVPLSGGGLPKETIALGGRELVVELARTNDEKRRGLSGRPVASPMLFVFEPPEDVAFWMRGMQQPIDILFFDANFRLAAFHDNAAPCPLAKECPLFRFAGAAAVLELPAGFRAALGLAAGSPLSRGNPAAF